ncbi:MAG TPA: flagellar biosynthetic protein FliR [Candidatus Tenderia sp.]|nr:flagellar biosynthetic protein FliR [Candidatus Tenderia sp.]
MSISETQLLEWISAFLLPFFRVAAFVTIIPIFSMKAVPAQIKLFLALCITIAVAPSSDVHVGVDPVSLQMFLLIVQQILVGLVMGFALQIVFAAFVNAGQLVGMQMGLGFAQMMDPATGVSVPVVSQFYNLVAILIFLSMNGHLIMISQLAQSFHVFPVGQTIDPKSFYDIVEYGLWVFKGALIMALPVVISLLMITMIMGVITRATPQMNIFAVGFSISIIGGFVVIFMTMQSAGEQMMVLMNHSLEFMGSVMLP